MVLKELKKKNPNGKVHLRGDDGVLYDQYGFDSN